MGIYMYAHKLAQVCHKKIVIDRCHCADQVPPTVWTLQRLPWNPGGCGMGELWGYKYTPMPTYVPQINTVD